ncbi:hypothetical protein J7T55_010491 [Diaporthe amygdali]|uniref:uncharacterized protein n=1 Tax=Phomopsis amygdali TaxID=1214568 RepID=UPI0022FE076B|nr:uncharacterized protein J7T55_010491 [Diaporthe amygdali]KAJ0115668.1 hypothetical protein J7T55_010491 [Diaporthe amygdali]
MLISLARFWLRREILSDSRSRVGIPDHILAFILPYSSNTSVHGTKGSSSRASKGRSKSNPSGSTTDNKPSSSDKSQQDELLLGVGGQFSGNDYNSNGSKGWGGQK